MTSDSARMARIRRSLSYRHVAKRASVCRPTEARRQAAIRRSRCRGVLPGVDMVIASTMILDQRGLRFC